MQWSVMTWNVRFNNPADGMNAWPKRSALVAELLHRTRPSLLGLQEVLPSMQMEIQAMLPDYACFGQPRRANDEGCPLFYRLSDFEVVRQETFWLSETPQSVGSVSWNASLPRICTWGLLESRRAPHLRLAVFNTHLDHVSELARERGVALILDVMQEHRGHVQAMMLMGDFNATPASRVVQVVESTNQSGHCDLRPALQSAYPLRKDDLFEGTFHGFHPESGTKEPMIDYLFVSSQITVESAVVVRDQFQGRYPSDHYPLLADLAL